LKPGRSSIAANIAVLAELVRGTLPKGAAELIPADTALPLTSRWP
jgi:hypothetical protein